MQDILKKLLGRSESSKFDETITLIAITRAKMLKRLYLLNMPFPTKSSRPNILVLSGSTTPKSGLGDNFTVVSKSSSFSMGRYRFALPVEMSDKDMNKFINMRFIPSNYSEFRPESLTSSISTLYTHDHTATCSVGSLSSSLENIVENIRSACKFISTLSSINYIYLKTTQTDTIRVDISKLKTIL